MSFYFCIASRLQLLRPKNIALVRINSSVTFKLGPFSFPFMAVISNFMCCEGVLFFVLTSGLWQWLESVIYFLISPHTFIFSCILDGWFVYLFDFWVGESNEHWIPDLFIYKEEINWLGCSRRKWLLLSLRCSAII